MAVLGVIQPPHHVDGLHLSGVGVQQVTAVQVLVSEGLLQPEAAAGNELVDVPPWGP